MLGTPYGLAFDGGLTRIEFYRIYCVEFINEATDNIHIRRQMR